jgi:hypothetical protein
MIKYGREPTIFRQVDLVPDEMMFYMYLPVKMAGSRNCCEYPENLNYMTPLFWMVEDYLKFEQSELDYDEHYIYATAKTMYVEGNFSGNRPGWHTDGFGSNGDLNFIWYDKNPTEFAIQEFGDISSDDKQSMIDIENQIKPECIKTYPCKTLLMLDEGIVHRVNPVIESGIRTFIKISVSKNKFNLKGNSHNYLFDYDWNMADRQTERNQCNNKDFK